jgi:hypothetical protein
MEAQVHSQAQQIFDFWKKTLGEQVSLVESFYEELGKIQSNGIAQVTANLDGAAKIAKDSVTQGQQLVAQWRKLTVETARRAVDFITPPKA